MDNSVPLKCIPHCNKQGTCIAQVPGQTAFPALRWTDVRENSIHIHSQQLCTRESGKRLYYFVPWTNDEKKKEKKRGRLFPLTDAIMNILERVKGLQEGLGIRSDFIFCNRDGTPIHSDNYEKVINHLFKDLGFKVRGNHALRKSLKAMSLFLSGFL